MHLVGIDGLNDSEGSRTLVTQVGLARHTLDDARSRLDLAVGALPDLEGEEAMATPALLLLLVATVRAKERLEDLEAHLRDLVEGASAVGDRI